MCGKTTAAGAVQSFAYEIKGNSAVIWRCFSRDTRAVIPQQLDGYPVTGIAPYAFSAHMGEHEIMDGLARGRLRLYVPLLFGSGDSGGSDGPDDSGEQEVPGDSENSGEQRIPDLPALCGDALEEIVFPESVLHVGRYCFYNCEHLRRLEFYGNLADWGSGVFTGCHHVRQLRVYVQEDGRSYLKDVLDELPEELEVEYCIRKRNTEIQANGFPRREECSGYEMAKLVFPEFYEEGVENTPARILETHIHGSGVRYRNCFQNRQFDFGQYDTLFVYARAQESGEILALLVMDRLRFPYKLSEKSKAQYEAYLAAQGEAFADLLLQQRDMEGLKWLMGTELSHMVNKEGTELRKTQLLTYVIEQASRRRYSEALSYLMDLRQRMGAAPGRRRRLEL